MFFPFITLNILCHSLLACRVSVKKSVDNFMQFPCMLSFFPLVAFNILSLSYFLSDWLLSALVCSSLHLSSLWLSELCRLGWLFISPCYRSFQILSFRIFSWVLSLFSLWASYIVNLGVFTVVPEVSYAVFIFFSVFYFAAVTFIILSSKSLIHSVLLPQLFCYWFLSIKCSSLFVCSLTILCLS